MVTYPKDWTEKTFEQFIKIKRGASPRPIEAYLTKSHNGVNWIKIGDANEYRIKNMRTKWGTCNIDKRRIWINLQLAKKPIECLEYVVTHELVHLVEKNHTNRFQASRSCS